MAELPELQEGTAVCFQHHFCATEAKALTDSKAHSLIEDTRFIHEYLLPSFQMEEPALYELLHVTTQTSH